MTYTKTDVKSLRDAWTSAKIGRQHTNNAAMFIFNADFDTARSAEAVYLLHDAATKITEAIGILETERARLRRIVEETTE